MANHTGKSWRTQGMRACAITGIFRSMDRKHISSRTITKAKKRGGTKAQIGRAENMSYYAAEDYFLCKAGRILARISTEEETSKDGSQRQNARYRSEDCGECPYRSACCKAKDARKQKEIVLCWEMADFRAASLERISTEEGALLRVNRPI